MEEVTTSQIESKTERFVDAHNHFNGVLPPSVIKVMLANAKRQWDKNGRSFEDIPEPLIENAESLDFDEDASWLDSLDIFCRLIVLNMENGVLNGESIEGTYYNDVRKMLFMDASKHSGRGMNSAGLLMAGCISIRCLLDLELLAHAKDGERESGPFFKEFGDEVDKNNLKFCDLFKASCITNFSSYGKKPDNGSNSLRSKWLFHEVKSNKFSSISNHMENIAESCVTAALSASLFGIFDDSFVLRALMRRSKTHASSDINNVNWHMLTLKWILEKEVMNSYYLMEISINVGKLDKMIEILDNNDRIEKFGILKKGSFPNLKYAPLQFKRMGNEKGTLFLRFLTGVSNYKALDEGYTAEEKNEIKNKIIKDSEHRCWAGIDIFGPECFKYDEKKFKDLLTFLYEILYGVKEAKDRRLWFRPHVGEGSWALKTFEERRRCFVNSPSNLLRGIKGFFKECGEAATQRQLNELLEYVYSSFFTERFPIFSLKPEKSFSIKSFNHFFIPSPSSKGVNIKEIAGSNLYIMLKWMREASKGGWFVEMNGPKVRIGHATHLIKFRKAFEEVQKMEERKRKSLWIDVNFGSNIISAANEVNYFLSEGGKKDFTEESRSLDKALEIIESAPFTSGEKLANLVARSNVIAKYVEAINNLGIKFVLGSDGQGVIKMKNELANFKLATDFISADSKNKLEKARKENADRYFKYCLGDIDPSFLFQDEEEEKKIETEEREEENKWLEEHLPNFQKNDGNVKRENIHKLVENDKIWTLKDMVNELGVDFRFESYESLLHIAVLKNKPLICKILIERGANVNLQNSDEESPLGLAIRGDDAEIKGPKDLVINQLLKSSDLDLEIKDNKNKTLLHLAAEHGDAGGILMDKLIGKMGQETLMKLMDKIDKMGKRPIEIAFEFGKSKAAILLYNKGIGLSAEHVPQSPLVQAVKQMDIAAVKDLLKQGAKVSGNKEENTNGLAAIYVAAGCNEGGIVCNEIVDLLLLYNPSYLGTLDKMANLARRATKAILKDAVGVLGITASAGLGGGAKLEIETKEGKGLVMGGAEMILGKNISSEVLKATEVIEDRRKEGYWLRDKKIGKEIKEDLKLYREVMKYLKIDSMEKKALISKKDLNKLLNTKVNKAKQKEKTLVEVLQEYHLFYEITKMSMNNLSKDSSSENEKRNLEKSYMKLIDKKKLLEKELRAYKEDIRMEKNK